MNLPGTLDLIIENLLPFDGRLKYIYPFYKSTEADQLYHELKDQIQWSQESIFIFGKDTKLPRLTAWYGDVDTNYEYSGLINTPIPWTKTLLLIKKKVEIETNTKFNSVLLNYYRDGRDHVSWHADDEAELGENPVIASLSFGESRTFKIKHKYKKDIKTLSLNAENGSLIIMSGGMQKDWLHSLTKTSKPISGRVNLTFRYIKNSK